MAVAPMGMHAFGQQATPENNPPVIELDAVTVSATRTESSAFKLPGSVSVIGRERIEEEQPSDLGDLLESLPGVSMSGGPRTAGEVPTIRGLGGDRILIRVDGARRNFASGHDGRVFIEPDLLKQIEVVRGPASSIYGSGALAGVLEMTTKDAGDFLEPGKNFGSKFRGGYQSAAKEKLIGGTMFGRIGDKTEILGDISYRDHSNIRIGGGGKIPESSGSIASGFVKLGFTPADFQTVKLSAQRYDDDSQVPNNPQGALGSSNAANARHMVQDELNLAYQYDEPGNDFLNLKANIYGNQLDLEEDQINSTNTETTEFDTWGLDVQNVTLLETSPSILNRLVYGFEFYSDSQDGTENGAGSDDRPAADAQTYGVFLQDEITLLENVTVIPGLRYDSYHRESSGLADTDETALSPKIAVGWQALPWLSLHGAYSHAFRAPSFIELYVSGQHFFGNNFVSNPDLKPEKARTWEGGFGLQFDDVVQANDSLRFKTTVFTETVKDFIKLEVTATTSTFQNVDDVDRRGGEAELAYATPTVSAALGYSVVRAADASNGDSIDSTPADTVNLRLGYKPPSSEFRFRWESSFVRAQQNADSDELTGGYAVHGLGLTWEPKGRDLDGLRVDLAVENLFDKHYERHNASLPEAGLNTKLTISQRF